METQEGITGRFKDAQWANANLEIIIGGAGGIGSWLTFFLSRLGNNNIALYDYDAIELHNVGGQLYPVKDLDRLKTDSLAETVSTYSDFNIITMSEKYVGQSASNVMFSAFDNMKARKEMVEAWYNHQLQKRAEGTARPEDVNIFIDGRMEAEQGFVYAVDSVSDYKRYMAEMFDDSEIQLGPCSFRATTHNAAILAGQMVAVLANHISNKKMGKKLKAVPFKVTYELPTMTYTIER